MLSFLNKILKIALISLPWAISPATTFCQNVVVKDTILNNYFCTHFPLAMSAGCTTLDTLKSESLYPANFSILLTNKGITNADEILFFKNVDTIYLNHNKLSSFPTDISRLRSVFRLNIANNMLTTAPSIHYTNSLSGDTAVKLVYLNNNLINTLPLSWYTSNTLTQVIDLSKNNLMNIPDFQNYTQIRRLDVSNNFLGFEDLIPIKLNPRWATSVFTLFPQKSFFVMDNLDVEEGYNVTIQVPGTILPTNTYYLLKGIQVVDSSTTGTFIIANIQLNQAGSYTVQIRNSNFSNNNEYLESTPFYINVPVKNKNVIIFSPNGDGVTDYLFINGTGTAKIITKDGIEINSFNLPFEWNGKDKSGKSLLPGLYYVIKSNGEIIKALIEN